MRDILFVQSQPPAGQVGRALLKTPHAIAVEVTHERIAYGAIIETVDDGFLLERLKRAVFQTVRDAILENSEESRP